MIDERLKEKLLAMTWDGLRAWSDPRSVTRGKEYVGQVETPAVFADGSVVSEVHGSDDYYTKLYVDADGDLRGEARTMPDIRKDGISAIECGYNWCFQPFFLQLRIDFQTSKMI